MIWSNSSISLFFCVFLLWLLVYIQNYHYKKKGQYFKTLRKLVISKSSIIAWFRQTGKTQWKNKNNTKNLHHILHPLRWSLCFLTVTVFDSVMSQFLRDVLGSSVVLVTLTFLCQCFLLSNCSTIRINYCPNKFILPLKILFNLYYIRIRWRDFWTHFYIL